MNIALPMFYNNETSFQPHPLTMNIQQSDVQCAIVLAYFKQSCAIDTLYVSTLFTLSDKMDRVFK